jgi:hypothetical protein
LPFILEHYQQYIVINLLWHLSLRTWIDIALVLIILEGSHRAITKREKEIAALKTALAEEIGRAKENN